MTSTSTLPIDFSSNPPLDPKVLAALALKKVLTALKRFGNQVSPTHETALRELLAGLAKQALGLRTGRIAYALPCGAGKTQSAVALIAAAHELDLPLTFAVSAAQVVALARLRKNLEDAGVPKQKIGLRHSKPDSEIARMAEQARHDGPDGEESLIEYLKNTGEAEFPIMLVCHARIRGAKEFPAFCKFQGRQRDLLIWDETLMTTDAEALSWLDVSASICRVIGELSEGSVLAIALGEIEDRLTREIESQRVGQEPSPCLLLSDTDVEAAQAEARALGQFGPPLRRAAVHTVRSMLRLAELPLSVALTGNGGTGDGVIHYTVAVDPQLKNIAVLDASYPVRLLAHESSILNGTTAAMQECKRYDRVKVVEYKFAAGKTTLASDRVKVRTLAEQVARLIRSLPETESILLFTHKGDDKNKLQTQMQIELQAEGIDLESKVNGQRRLNWLTWGSETSLSTMKHCKHVILCGILRRNPLELAASMAGQKRNLCYRMELGELQALLISEMAHCTLQAMNRGSCRTVDAEGMAGAMTLTIFANVNGLKEALASSLPGIDWSTAESHGSINRTKTAANAIFAYLKALPLEVNRITVQCLKKQFCLDIGKEAITKAIDDAIVQSTLSWLKGGQKWQRSSRSLVRVTC